MRGGFDELMGGEVAFPSQLVEMLGCSFKIYAHTNTHAPADSGLRESEATVLKRSACRGNKTKAEAVRNTGTHSR